MATDQHTDDPELVPDSEQTESANENTAENSGDGSPGGNVQGDNELNNSGDEVAALQEKLLLAHADMQNIRRRSERDVANAHKFALEKFVAELLPVVDNLERALASTEQGGGDLKPVIEGVELTLKSFLDALRRFNVEQVDPAGEPFNPERHEAMAMVPNPAVAPGSVIEVFQKGYLLNGRLVRPAMVVVASNGNDS